MYTHCFYRGGKLLTHYQKLSILTPTQRTVFNPSKTKLLGHAKKGQCSRGDRGWLLQFSVKVIFCEKYI